MVRFLSLASGSSGNCFYLGTEEYGILIDAGIPVRTIRKTLKDSGIGLERVMALFVTHDHADHIRSVGVLGEKCYIPVFATKRIHEGMSRSYCMTEKLSSSVRYMEKGQEVCVRDITLESFDVPHDATETVGYQIRLEGKTFCFITDVGSITPEVEQRIASSDYLVVECNYDSDMLQHSRYPLFLRERIASGFGHISNEQMAKALQRNVSVRHKAVFLCHLSKENNHPDLVEKVVREALDQSTVNLDESLIVKALNRYSKTGPFDFE